MATCGARIIVPSLRTRRLRLGKACSSLHSYRVAAGGCFSCSSLRNPKVKYVYFCLFSILLLNFILVTGHVSSWIADYTFRSFSVRKIKTEQRNIYLSRRKEGKHNVRYTENTAPADKFEENHTTWGLTAWTQRLVSYVKNTVRQLSRKHDTIIRSHTPG